MNPITFSVGTMVSESNWGELLGHPRLVAVEQFGLYCLEEIVEFSGCSSNPRIRKVASRIDSSAYYNLIEVP